MFNETVYEVHLLNLIIATVIFVFAIWEWTPIFKKLQFSKSLLPLGGAMSGFLGGLLGYQFVSIGLVIIALFIGTGML